MRIFHNETIKVLRSPMVLAVTAFLLVLNAVLLFTWTPKSGIPADAYKSAYEYFLESDPRKNELTERYQQLYTLLMDGDMYEDSGSKAYKPAFTDDIWTEYQLLKELNEQKESAEHYSEYLAHIRQQAGSGSDISIFTAKDPYTAADAKQTAEAYASLEGIQPVFINSMALSEATDFPATDFLVLLVLFLMLYYLMIWEREQGLVSLQMTMLRGRSHLMAAKAMVLLLGSVLVNLLFWGCNLLLAGRKYGTVDFSAPIQSVEDFVGCALPVSIGQYWLLFVGVKILVCFSLAVLFLYLAARCGQVQTVWLTAGLVFTGSYTLYRWVDGKSALALLKYCNIIPVLNVNALLHYYFNLNVLGHPVTAVWAIPVLCGWLLVLFGGLLLLQAKPKYMLKLRQKRVRSRTMKKAAPNWGLLRYEAYKSLILQKGLLILCLFAAFHVLTAVRNDIRLTGQEQTYRSYMQQLEGPVTEEKRAWISGERARLDKYNTMLMDAKAQYDRKEISDAEWNAVQQLVSSQTSGQEAFALVEERLHYLEDYTQRSGIDPGFVYESGYEYLSGTGYTGYRNDRIHAMLLMAVSILLFSGLFCGEYTSGMVRLLAVSKKGRRATILRKLLLALVAAVVLFVSVYGADLIHALRSYGLPSLSADCAAIPALEAFGELPLLHHLIWVHIVRFFSFLSLSLLFFLLSVLTRNAVKAIMVGLILLVFPLFAALLGIGLIDCVSLNVFLTGNQFLNLAADGKAFVLLIPAALGAVSGLLLEKGMFWKI